MKKNVLNTLITWYSASKVLPATDGKYLCYPEGSCSIKELPYSADHRMFNVSNGDLDTAIDVLWWAEVPALPGGGH